jgi:hypothetical protein
MNQHDAPYLIGLQCRDNQAYIGAQGATGAAALHATAARNLRLEADQTVYFVVTGSSDAFISHERVGSADAVLAATVMGRAVP